MNEFEWVWVCTTCETTKSNGDLKVGNKCKLCDTEAIPVKVYDEHLREAGSDRPRPKPGKLGGKMKEGEDRSKELGV